LLPSTSRQSYDAHNAMSSFNRLHLIRQVDLFTLRLFLSAAEEQQIGLAAIRENIAASTATKRIHDLEEIAGVKLLERTPKGVSPTPAGAVLVRYIRMIFDNLESMRSEIAAFTEGMRGEVTIASARSIIVPFLARELGDYSRNFPLVDLAVHEVDNAEIIEAVAHGKADIGVFARAYELDLGGVDVVPYRHDRMVAVVPAGHPLCERRKVSFEDLLPENLIAVGAMQAAFRVAAKRLGREFKPKFSVRSAGVAMSLVQARLGVTVQPECLLGIELFDKVAAIALDEPWATRSIDIATARGRALSPAASALLEQLLDRPGDAADPPAA
jgi:DNA-binding transcriptional LysR family regulator